MAKALFPEYKRIWYDDQYSTVDFFRTNEEGRTFIHWFEFCMTTLSPMILDDTCEYNEGDFPSILQDFRGYDLYHSETGDNFPHPVDYLYEFFKIMK